MKNAKGIGDYVRRRIRIAPCCLGEPAALPEAMHLATALLWKESTGAGLVMAIPDAALALAARAYGLTVVGVPQP